jgi:hypothetical protein
MVRFSLVSWVVIVGEVLFNPKIRSPEEISPAVPSKIINALAVAVVDLGSEAVLPNMMLRSTTG